MKTALLKGAKIGSIAGFMSASTYAIIFLIVAELVLPFPKPSATLFFDRENMRIIFPVLLGLTPTWLIIPTFIGILTGMGFGFLLAKFNPTYKIYIAICTGISALIAFSVSMLGFLYMITTSYGNFFTDVFWNGHIQTVFLLMTGLVFIPSALYVAVSFIVSQRLHKTLTQQANGSISSPQVL